MQVLWVLTPQLTMEPGGPGKEEPVAVGRGGRQGNRAPNLTAFLGSWG